MARFFLHLAYKGTAYHGWQRQENSVSVQGTIEERLRRIGIPHEGLHGCGRTDTGVHATSYYAHLDAEIKDIEQAAFSLNAVLPADIGIYKVIPVHDEAHARFDALERTYRYHIHHRKEPFAADRSLLYWRSLDISEMNKACEHLLGKQAFTSFARLHGGQKHDFCDVKFAHWVETNHGAMFEIRADRFLRNMVRAIVGTLIEVGTGKIGPAEVSTIISAKDRASAGSSAPAQGLSLHKISYPYIEDNG